MQNFLLVALGGGLGAAGRYALSLATPPAANGWPWSTFIINVSGSFLMGLLAGWLAQRSDADGPWRLLLGTGVLGGFTTFSAFSLETASMIERRDYALAATYAIGSVILGLVGLFAGLALSRRGLA